MKPKVFLAGKPKRGSSVKFPARKGLLRVDVTSGAGLILQREPERVYAKELSPLLIGDDHPFENTWQYTKVYPQLGHWKDEKPTKKWEEWRKSGFKKRKRGKGVRTPPEVSKLQKDNRKPLCAWWKGEKLGYIESRKKIYVPEYAKLIRKSRAFAALIGKDVLVIGIDGPPLDKYPNGFEVTEERLVEALNDPTHPFGHSYVVAAELAGIELK